MCMTMQSVVIPTSGQYFIEVVGATSGGRYGSETTVCSGAYISATVAVNQGDKLFIIVGGQGATTMASNNQSATGGGGGTFVFLQSSSSSVPILTAGVGLCMPLNELS